VEESEEGRGGGGMHAESELLLLYFYFLCLGCGRLECAWSSLESDFVLALSF
jgi:hypothetical protein